jgi:anti-sigma-K factor RskA
VERDAIHDLTAAYALNALDRDDETEYEAHLGRCDACRRELASLQEAASALAFVSEGPAPRPGLRSRILAEARSERGTAVARPRSWALPLTAAAAVAATAAAIGLGVWAASLSSNLDAERRARASEQRATAILAAADASRIPLSGASGSLVVTPTGEAALVVSRLDRAPAEKTYEAWVIEDGQPRPAGLFRGGGERTVVPLARPVPRGAVVAVTIEEEGGAEQPQGKPLFMAQTA